MKPYRAPRWLPNRHAQTLWPLAAKTPLPPYRRERWVTPDGDFIDLDWLPDRADAPLLVLFHGLEGSSRSHYARSIMGATLAQGWNGVVPHFRGCSGEPNRYARAYHSGDSAEIDWILARLAARHPAPVVAAGISLGGNALLKYLGERGTDTPLTTAVAVSVPFRLDRAADRMERGISRLYQWHLLRHLRAHTRAKFRHMPSPIDLSRLDAMTTFRRFDDAVTARLHGFAGVDDYYTRSSSRQFLKAIRIPTLILHAEDDPFMTPDAIPAANELSPDVTLELSKHGGHVGFVGAGPNRYWADARIAAHLAHYPG